MILHDYAFSGNGYKVRLLLTQLGIPFETVEYDIDRGETRTQSFLDNVNSNGRIPVLEDDGEFLPESNAILYYLAEGTPYLPDSRIGRAQVLRWMFFEQYSHEPNIATSRYWLTHDVELTEEKRLALESKRKLGHDALGVMERHLAGSEFFVETYSIADIALYAYTHVAGQGGFDLEGYPEIRSWFERVEATSGYVPM